MINVSLSKKLVTKSKLEVVSEISSIVAVDIGSPDFSTGLSSATDGKREAEDIKREVELESSGLCMGTKAELGAVEAVTGGDAISISNIDTTNSSSVMRSSSSGVSSLTGEGGTGMATKNELKLDIQGDVGTVGGKLIEQSVRIGDVGSSQGRWTGY
jgi:hypothetical protein